MAIPVIAHPNEGAIKEVARALHRAWCPLGTCDYGVSDRPIAERAVAEALRAAPPSSGSLPNRSDPDV